MYIHVVCIQKYKYYTNKFEIKKILTKGLKFLQHRHLYAS